MTNFIVCPNCKLPNKVHPLEADCIAALLRALKTPDFVNVTMDRSSWADRTRKDDTVPEPDHKLLESVAEFRLNGGGLAIHNDYDEQDKPVRTLLLRASGRGVIEVEQYIPIASYVFCYPNCLCQHCGGPANEEVSDFHQDASGDEILCRPCINKSFHSRLLN